MPITIHSNKLHINDKNNTKMDVISYETQEILDNLKSQRISISREVDELTTDINDQATNINDLKNTVTNLDQHSESVKNNLNVYLYEKSGEVNDIKTRITDAGNAQVSRINNYLDTEVNDTIQNKVTSAINSAQTAIVNEDVRNIIAAPFDITKSYKADEYFLATTGSGSNTKAILYKFITDHAPGAYTSNEIIQIKFAEDTAENVKKVVMVSNNQPDENYNKIWVDKSSNTVKQVPTYEEFTSLIIIDNEEPTEIDNKLWIDSNVQSHIQIPTYDEFLELKEMVLQLLEQQN